MNTCETHSWIHWLQECAGMVRKLRGNAENSESSIVQSAMGCHRRCETLKEVRLCEMKRPVDSQDKALMNSKKKMLVPAPLDKDVQP